MKRRTCISTILHQWWVTPFILLAKVCLLTFGVNLKSLYVCTVFSAVLFQLHYLSQWKGFTLNLYSSFVTQQQHQRTFCQGYCHTFGVWKCHWEVWVQFDANKARNVHFLYKFLTIMKCQLCPHCLIAPAEEGIAVCLSVSLSAGLLKNNRTHFHENS